MNKLILLLALFTSLTHAAETATQAFARLPPLASAATPDMDCSAAEAVGKKVEARLAPMRTMSMTPGGSVANPTPAQAQAMAAMGEPAFNDCVTRFQTSPHEPWVQPLRDKLAAKLEQIDEAYRRASEAFCQKSNDPNCRGSPAIDRQFNQQAAAAGTQFLKDAQPHYARYAREVGDCIGRRERMLGGADGGGNTAMDMIFASQVGLNWGLLNLPAAANSNLCEAARDAASQHLYAP